MALLLGKKDTPILKQLTILFVLTWHTRISYCHSYFKVSKASNKRKCSKKWTNGLIAGWERHTHIKTIDDNICTNMKHLNIISSLTFIVSIASNKSKCSKKRTNGLFAGWERHTHFKTTDKNICTNMTQLNIISLFTFVVSIASNKRKCSQKWTNGLIAGCERHSHIKTAYDVICTNFKHLNMISLFILKVSKASNKRKCSKKGTNGLIAGLESHIHIKTTDDDVICTNFKHLNMISSFIFKV